MRLLYSLLILYIFLGIARSAPFVFTGGGTGGWTDVKNWSPSTAYPKTADDATFSGATGKTTVFVGPVHDIVVSSNEILNFNSGTNTMNKLSVSTGTVNIYGNMNITTGLSLSNLGVIGIDSSGGGITINKLLDQQGGTLVVNCASGISLSTSENSNFQGSGVQVLGANGCVFAAKTSNSVKGDVTITNSTFKLDTNNNIDSKLTIQTNGKIQTDHLFFSSTGSLNLLSGVITGISVTYVPLSASSSSVTISSGGSFNLDIQQIQTLTLNNVALNIVVSGSNAMQTTGTWQFTQCGTFTTSKDWSISNQVNVGNTNSCNLQHTNGVLNVNNVLQLQNSVFQITGGSVTAGGSGQIVCTVGQITVNGGGFDMSGAGSVMSIGTGCTLALTSSSSTINLNDVNTHGAVTVGFNTIFDSFISDALVDWQSGTFSGTTLTLSNNVFTVSTASGDKDLGSTSVGLTATTVTITGSNKLKLTNPNIGTSSISSTNGGLSISSGGTISSSSQNTKFMTVSSGTVSYTNSTVDIKGDFTVASPAIFSISDLTSTLTTYSSTHLDVYSLNVINSATANINCASNSNSGFTINGAATVNLQCALDITSGTISGSSSNFNLQSDMTLSNSTAQITLNSGNINIDKHVTFGGLRIQQAGGSVKIRPNGIMSIAADTVFTQYDGKLNITGGTLSVESDYTETGTHLVGSSGSMTVAKGVTFTVDAGSTVALKAVPVALGKDAQINLASTTSTLAITSASLTLSSNLSLKNGVLDMSGSVLGPKSATITLANSARLQFNSGVSYINTPITVYPDSDGTAIEIRNPGTVVHLNSQITIVDQTNNFFCFWCDNPHSMLIQNGYVIVDGNTNLYVSNTNVTLIASIIDLASTGSISLSSDTLNFRGYVSFYYSAIVNSTKNWSPINLLKFQTVFILGYPIPSYYFNLKGSYLGSYAILNTGRMSINNEQVFDDPDSCKIITGVQPPEFTEPQLFSIESNGHVTIKQCVILENSANFTNNGKLDVLSPGNITINSDSEMWFNPFSQSTFDNAIIIFNGTRLYISENLVFKNQANFSMHNTSTIRMLTQSATLNFTDHSSAVFNQSSVLQNAGMFLFNDSSTMLLNFITGNFDGGFLFDHSSNLTIMGSNILGVGNSTIMNSVFNLLQNSSYGLTGPLLFNDSSVITLDYSNMTLYNILQVDTSTFDLNNGSYFYSNFTIYLNESTFSVNDGSNFTFVNGSMVLTSISTINFNSIVIPIINNCSILVNNSIITSQADITFENYSNLTLVELGSFSPTGITVIVDSTSVLQNNNGTISTTSTTLEIDGQLLMDNFAVLSGITNSHVTISTSSTLNSNSSISLDTSTLDLLTDLFIGFGASLSASNSTVQMNGLVNVQDGKIIASSGSQITMVDDLYMTTTDIIPSLSVFTGSTLLSSTGTLLDLSQYYVLAFVANSTLTAQTLKIHNNALLSLTNSQASIATDLYSHNSAAIFLSGSTFNVSEGATANFIDFAKIYTSSSSSLYFKGQTNLQNNANITMDNSIFANTDAVTMQDLTTFVARFSQTYFNATVTSLNSSISWFSTPANITDTSFTCYNETTLLLISSALVSRNSSVNLFNSTNCTIGDSSSITIVSGSLNLFNSTIITTLTTNSYVSIGGYLNTYNYTSIILQSGHLDINGIATFDDYSYLELVDPDSTFTVQSGNLTFLGNTKVLMTNNSVAVENGAIIFKGSSNKDVYWDSIIIEVTGTYIIDEQAYNNLSNFEIDIKGTFFTDHDISLILKTGQIKISGTDPSVYLNGSSQSVHSFNNVQVFVNSGFLQILGDTTPKFFNQSSISITLGYLLASNYSKPLFEDTYIYIDFQSSIGMHFEEYSQPTFNTTRVDIMGFLKFSDNVISAVNNTYFNISGNIFFENDSHSSFNVSELLVEGHVAMYNSSYVNAVSTFFRVTTGNFYLNNNSTLEFLDNNCTILVLSGNIILYDGSKSIAPPGTNVTIETGSFLTHNDSTLDWENTTVFIDSGSFSNYENSILNWMGISLTIVTGAFELHDSSNLNINESSLVIKGNFSTFNDLSLYSGNTTYNIIGSVILSGELISTHLFHNDTIYILGNMFFLEKMDPLFYYTIIRVNSGLMKFDNFVQSTFTSCDVRISDGSIVLYEQSNMLFNEHSSLALLHAGNSYFGTFDNATVTFQYSPVLIYGGDILISNYSDFSVDANSPITVFNGNFFVTDHGNLFTAKKSIITISLGNMALYDYVDVSFDEVNITISGNYETHDNTKSDYLSCFVDILAGSFTSTGYSSLSLHNTSITIENGAYTAYDNVTVDANNSSIVIVTDIKKLGTGRFSVYDYASVNYSFVQLNVSGEFTLQNFGEFHSSDSNITIISGVFGLYEKSSFNSTNINLDVIGEFLLTNFTSFTLNDSRVNISGNFEVSNSSYSLINSSIIRITNGSFDTFNDINFTATYSSIYMNGSIYFSGSQLSSHNFYQSSVHVQLGNFTFTEEITGTFQYTNTTITGGYHNQLNNSKVYYSNSSLNLDGEGTLVMLDYSYWSAENSSVVSVVSEGATAIFCDHSVFEVSTNSSFNIYNGTVLFCGNASANMNQNTFFNLLNGSFILSGSSSLSIDKNTTGKIVGGSLYVIDDAVLVINSAEISIEGGINHNSTIPLRIDNGTSVVINLHPIVVSASANFTVHSSNLVILQSSLILHDYAILDDNNGNITITKGSILAYDHSSILMYNESVTTILEGNITVYNFACYTITNSSFVNVSSTAQNYGLVYLQDDSCMIISNDSLLYVDNGKVVLDDRSTLTSNNSTISLNGNFEVLRDANIFYYDSILNISSNGNFTAHGVSSEIDIISSQVILNGGTFALSLRSFLLATNSNMTVLSGKTIFTDLSTTDLRNTQFNITGDLTVLIKAVFRVDASSVFVTDSGNANFSEFSYLTLVNSGNLTVSGGGSIFFQNDTLLSASESSFCSVSGGGSIFISGRSVVELSSNSSLLVSEGGNIEFSDNSTLRSFDSFLNVTGGNINFENGSKIDCYRSFLDVDGGDINLSGDNSTSVIQENSFFNVTSGNVNFSGSKIIYFNHSFIYVKGNLTSHEYSTFIFMNESATYIVGGDFRTDGYSQTNISSSTFSIEYGSVKFSDFTVMSIYNSTIDVTLSADQIGFFSISGSSFVNLNNSLIQVTGGNYTQINTTVVESYFGTLNVKSGFALFQGNSSYKGNYSFINVTGGDLQIFENSTWSYDSSYATVSSGGNLLIYNQTETTLTNSSFIVYDGNCDIFGTSKYNMSTSYLTVKGGNLFYREFTTVYALDSNITVTGGQIIHEDSSKVDIQGSNVTVNKESSARLVNSDILVFQNGTSFHSNDSNITVINGNMLFTDIATSDINVSIILITGGNLVHQVSTVVSLSSSVLNITAGSFAVYDSSKLYISSDTQITVDGGNFLVQGSPLFSLLQSSMNILNGLVSVSGGLVDIQSSSLNVTENGEISFGGSAAVSMVDSSLLLDGNGEFTVTNNSTFKVDKSNLQIHGGNFNTLGNTLFQVTNSIYNITNGNTLYGGSSVVDVSTSLFTISGGNVEFGNSSTVTIHFNTTYEVTGGNVITSGTTSVTVDHSCFNLYFASLFYNDGSSVVLIDSCWNILAGNATFEGSSQYELNHSNLTIYSGNFIALDSAKINATQDSLILVEGGVFKTGGSSATTVYASTIKISNGYANWTDSSSFDFINSLFSVSGGNSMFSGFSKTNWISSEIDVANGGILFRDYSNNFFTNTQTYVAGSIIYEGFSSVLYESSSISISIGSIEFNEYASCYFRNVDIAVNNGNLQYAGNSNVTFDSSSLTLGEGQLEFFNYAEVVFLGSTINLYGGSVTAQDQVNIAISNCELSVGGNFYTQNSAELIIDSTYVSINGSMYTLDIGSMSISSSSISISSGNMIISNENYAIRKQVAFSNSDVKVKTDATLASGSLEISGNVDVTLLKTNFSIDGDLSMSGKSKLYIYHNSTFNIPTGVVSMDEIAQIEISEDSALYNQGTFFVPGTIAYPTGASVRNSGLMQSDHNLSINCGSGIATPVSNTGSMLFNNNANSCIDNLDHKGLLQLSGSNVTLGTYSNDRFSSVTIRDSKLTMLNKMYGNQGSFGGRGEVVGNFNNQQGASIMSNGDFGATSLKVTEDFATSGTIYFTISSRDANLPNSWSVINANKGVKIDGGKTCICISPDLTLQPGDQWDLLNAGTGLFGTFDNVEFNCVECPSRATRNVQSTESTCDPTASYGSRSFSVLFEACGGGSGSNFLTSITPAYYVIIPVAVGIILLVIIIFGGALFIDERYRKIKVTKRAAVRRKNYLQQLHKEGRESLNPTSTSSTSLDV